MLNQFDKNTFKYITDEKEDTDCYVFCSDKYLVIAFRGTSFTFSDGFSFTDVKQGTESRLRDFIYCF